MIILIYFMMFHVLDCSASRGSSANEVSYKLEGREEIEKLEAKDTKTEFKAGCLHHRYRI